MHILFDVRGVLDDESVSPSEWRDLFKQLRENSHTIGVITSGDFSKNTQAEIGIDDSEFDDVYKYSVKSSKSTYEDIAVEKGIDVKNMGVVDDELINLWTVGKLEMLQVYYRGFEGMKTELKNIGLILA